MTRLLERSPIKVHAHQWATRSPVSTNKQLKKMYIVHIGTPMGHSHEADYYKATQFNLLVYNFHC